MSLGVAHLLLSIYNENNESSTLCLPSIFIAPVMPDIGIFIHYSITKYIRQAEAALAVSTSTPVSTFFK